MGAFTLVSNILFICSKQQRYYLGVDKAERNRHCQVRLQGEALRLCRRSLSGKDAILDWIYLARDVYSIKMSALIGIAVHFENVTTVFLTTVGASIRAFCSS